MGYKRSAALYAIWQALTGGRAGKDVPDVVRTRARDLGKLGVPLPPERRPGRPGTDIEFTASEVFELALGLAMAEAGLNQAAIAFIIHHRRLELQDAFGAITAEPIGLRDRRLQEVGQYFAFRYSEFREAWPLFTATSAEGWDPVRGRPPLFIEARILRGTQNLSEYLETMTLDTRADMRMVFALSPLAKLLNRALAEAPDLRRGRS